jgi:hypothetical protein
MANPKKTKMLPQSDGAPRRTYRGKRAGVSEDTGQGILEHPEIAKRLSVRELKFLDAYHQLGSLRAAYRTLQPTASDTSSSRKGGHMIKVIRQKITQDEEWELMGVSLAKIGKAVSEGMGATFVRSFITRDGRVIETPEYPDHAVRQTAVGNAMKLRKLDKGEEMGGINVKIMMFAHPDAPRWPGSGDSEPIDVTPEDVDL